MFSIRMSRRDFLLGFIVFFTMCGSVSVPDNRDVPVQREKNILNNYSEDANQRYKDLLVDLANYTSNGARYQKKFIKHLIGIAADITEKKKLTVKKKSLGFYYDKKSYSPNKLYLGLDIELPAPGLDAYSERAVFILKNYLLAVLDTIQSCRSVFYEDDIIGMVIGWQWTKGDKKECITIWIKKEDVLAFEGRRLTFEELLEQSTTTETNGKTIVLPL